MSGGVDEIISITLSTDLFGVTSDPSICLSVSAWQSASSDMAMKADRSALRRSAGISGGPMIGRANAPRMKTPPRGAVRRQVYMAFQEDPAGLAGLKAIGMLDNFL
jgi:hypothetical protein